MTRRLNMPSNVKELQVLAKRQAATIELQSRDIAMLRRKTGELREELETYKDRKPNAALVQHNRNCMKPIGWRAKA